MLECVRYYYQYAHDILAFVYIHALCLINVSLPLMSHDNN